MRLKLSWFLAFSLVLGIGLLWNKSSLGMALANGAGLSAAARKSSRAGLAPVRVSSTPACYTWDFLNNTGQDADGLVIHLKGIPAITDVYTGVLNPFGAPDPTSAYDPGTDVYSLLFKGGTVAVSSMVEIGICTLQPALRLDAVLPAFYWVVSGSPADPAPLFAGLDFNWVDSNHLQVHLYNEQSTPLNVFSFYVLTPGSPLSLDDLNDGVTSTLPMASDQVSDPLALAGGASTTFDVFFSQSDAQQVFGAPVVLEAVLSAQDDPSNSIHVFAQTFQPFSEAYFPVIKK